MRFHLAFCLGSNALSLDRGLSIPPQVKEDECDQEDLPEELLYFKLVPFLTKVEMVDPDYWNRQHHTALFEYSILVLDDLHTKVGSEGLKEHKSEAERVQLFLFIQILHSNGKFRHAGASHRSKAVWEKVAEEEENGYENYLPDSHGLLQTKRCQVLFNQKDAILEAELEGLEAC